LINSQCNAEKIDKAINTIDNNIINNKIKHYSPLQNNSIIAVNELKISDKTFNFLY